VSIYEVCRCRSHIGKCSEFAVRSLPTVVLMADGQLTDGFTGLKAEPEIREMLAKYLP